MIYLQHRRCSLLGIDACPDLESQRQRFLRHGWAEAWGLDMADVYNLLPKEERARYVAVSSVFGIDFAVVQS